MPENRIKKYVDLVYRMSGKWPNWDPAIPIAVGSYGELNQDGELIVDGNIYDDPDILKSLKDNGLDLLLDENKPAFGELEQHLIVCSVGVKGKEFSVGGDVHVPHIASASIKGSWQFQDGKHGALLILHKPRQNFIPNTVKAKILKVKKLEGKHVVTSALACPAFLLYISDRFGGSFSVAFSAGNAAASGSLEAGWWTSLETAFIRKAFNADNKPCFIPLLSLQEVCKPSWFPKVKFRGEEDPDSLEEHVWHDVYPPWKPLDEDGREIED